MLIYKQLAESVIIQSNLKRPMIEAYDHSSLTLIGMGRSAYVFRINQTNKALKVFFPTHQHIAKEEAEIYRHIHHIHYFPTLYDHGANYIVIDFIDGYTLFDCLTRGIKVSEAEIIKVDHALELARNEGLTPSDIHLRNIILTPKKEIKVIDVARFRQHQNIALWDDLKTAYYRYYSKSFFPKRLPALLLNFIAVLYKYLNRQRLYMSNH